MFHAISRQRLHTVALMFMAGALVAPGLSQACACGCGVFDVGTSSMYANHAGGMAFFEYDYMDQSNNRSGTSSAPADANADKAVRTSFFTLGAQYFFNRSWGLSADVPYWHRYFQTQDADTLQIVDSTHGAVGDIRLKGIYSGFSPDMSTGLTFGVKLANGDSSYPDFDPDTEIGTGSTDLLVGAYHLGRITTDNRWSYFAQWQWDQPVAHKDNYRPGAEGVVALGAYYEGWSAPSGVRFSPVAQLRTVYRRQDGGVDGHPEDTGYTRVLASPGIEIAAGKFRLNADVALPLYTNARGNQLFANELWKLNVAYHF
jgi:hypothetical protein